MDQYVLVAKPVAGSKGKFEDYQIVKYVDETSIGKQISEGFETALGPTSLSDCVNKLKEINVDKSGWFGLTVAQYALIFIVTLAFVIAIIWGASGLSSLVSKDNGIQSHDESARFLITFMVAVGTIAIAFLAILTAMVIREYKERFAAAKEVLILLIGILGTIVGFYFGAAKNTNSNQPANLSNTVNQSTGTNNSANINSSTKTNTNSNANTSQ